MTKLIYIILVNYNGFNDTCECLESIIKSTYKNFKILIVDNNSLDGSGMRLKKKYPQYEYILSDTNLGFAEANNIAYKHALKNGAEYVLLLNNDTIIDKNMIQKLIDQSNNNIVTVPKMYYYLEKNKIWYGGGEISKTKGTVYHIGEKKFDSNKYSKTKEVSFATGCCILIHKDILNEIGLFDKKYFMYCEDFDFSIRLIKSNKKILYVPEAMLWHKVNASTKNNSNISKYYLTRNRFYLLKNHRDIFKLNAILYSYITRFIIIIKSLIIGKRVNIYFEALKDYRNNRMGRKDFN